jgi:hypothetical protein
LTSLIRLDSPQLPEPFIFTFDLDIGYCLLDIRYFLYSM